MNWANIAKGIPKNNITIAANNKSDIDLQTNTETITGSEGINETISIDEYYSYFFETKLFDKLVVTIYNAQANKLDIANYVNTSDLLDFFSNYVDYDSIETMLELNDDTAEN